MIEFAIVSPLALLLVLGIIQAGLLYSAKEIVNEAAFLSARAGAVSNARSEENSPMMQALVKGLVPFYQNSTNYLDTSAATEFERLAMAWGKAQFEAPPICIPSVSCYIQVDVLNPGKEAFDDFGVVSRASDGHTYIPNDNLEYRPHEKIGASSGLSIQDANALRVRVTYGYQIKVPLMQTVIEAVMCGVNSGIDAFGNGKSPVSNDCVNFYSHGRVPIVAYATVQMQTPAWKQED